MSDRIFDEKWSRVRERGGESLASLRPRGQADWLYLRRTEQLRRVAAKRLGNRPLRALEVGCGRGTVSQFLAADGHDTVLLDTSPDALDIARRNFEAAGLHGEFVLGDAEQLPFGDGAFDLVFSIGLLEHFDDPSRLIAEKRRVARPGGLIWDEVIPDTASVQTVAAPLTGAIRGVRRLRRRLGGLPPKPASPPRYRVAASSKDLRRHFAQAGEVVTFGTIPVPALPLVAGGRPDRATIGAWDAVLRVRAAVLDDPWRCSERWGRSFVIAAQVPPG
jgi:ubiquinone/menaquinone biosynthesis C-methylase UbiE